MVVLCTWKCSLQVPGTSMSNPEGIQTILQYVSLSFCHSSHCWPLTFLKLVADFFKLELCGPSGKIGAKLLISWFELRSVVNEDWWTNCLWQLNGKRSASIPYTKENATPESHQQTWAGDNIAWLCTSGRKYRSSGDPKLHSTCNFSSFTILKGPWDIFPQLTRLSSQISKVSTKISISNFTNTWQLN